MIMPIDCFVVSNFFSRLFFNTVWPLVAYTVLILLSTGLHRVGRERLASNCIETIFAIMFFMFAPNANGLFSMFYCVPLEDNTSWLRVDLSIQCTDTTGATTESFVAMQGYAIVMII